VMLAYEFTVTLPLFAEFTFGAGPGGFAAMTSLMGAGAVVGGLATASRGEPTAARLARSAAVFGALVLAFSLAPTLTVALVLIPLVGAASISLIALTNSSLQLRAAPELRGRVMALYAVALLGSTPVGGPVVGYLGEQAGPRVALAVGALSALLGAAYVWHRLVRTSGRWDQSSCPSVDEAVTMRSSIIAS
jgi:MFS family permease